jgi:hypothetical protein
MRLGATMKTNVAMGRGIAVAAAAPVVSGCRETGQGLPMHWRRRLQRRHDVQGAHGHNRVSFEKSKAACIKSGGWPG